MTSPRRTYGGIPGDERRHQRRERLVDAAIDVVAEGGLAAITVGATCARAGVGKRYFYESFESVDALLSSALERVFLRVGDVIGASDLRPEDPPERLLEIAALGALEALDDPRVARFYLEVSASQAGLVAREAGVDLLAAALLERIVGSDRASPAARLLGSMLIAGTHHAVATWLRGGSGLSREELLDLVVGIGSDAAARMRRDAAGAGPAPSPERTGGAEGGP